MKIANFSGRISEEIKIEDKNKNKLAKFQLAINEKNKETEYFKFVAWGKVAEVIETYAFKGQRANIIAEPVQVHVNGIERVYFQITKIEFLDFKEKKKEYVNDYDW